MTTSPHEPIHALDDSVYCGLTKREYFAAFALQGLLSTAHQDFEYNSAEVCQKAVEHADTLIKALNGEIK